MKVLELQDEGGAAAVGRGTDQDVTAAPMAIRRTILAVARRMRWTVATRRTI